MTALPPRLRRYVGISTRAHCMLHDQAVVNFHDTVVKYVLSLSSDSLLVVGVFPSDLDAMCWLTNPLTHEAVMNCCSSEPPTDGAGAETGSWYGVVNASSSSAVDISANGLGVALSIITTLGVGISVVRRFSTELKTVQSMATSKARDLFLVVRAAGCWTALPHSSSTLFASPAGSPTAADASSRRALAQTGPPSVRRTHCASGIGDTDDRASSLALKSSVILVGGVGADDEEPKVSRALFLAGRVGGNDDSVVKIKNEPFAKDDCRPALGLCTLHDQIRVPRVG
eukprot:TRINITY_DN4284_c0_g1_i1.p1 TRINITY_DN4284_c0_g1~~TRINITY_DN4284_c0_g1_i1.p1  ORF type:complete len:285 (-),score=22.12 TRINITY_DN4284_c0_g1_i1:1084-1938(-)